MKPKYKGWKEGVLTRHIRNAGGDRLVKGEVVRYKP